MTAILELASKLANDLIRPPKLKQLFIVFTYGTYIRRPVVDLERHFLGVLHHISFQVDVDENEF